MSTRRGSSLAELVLVAWLFALVLAALARFAGAQGRLVAAQQDRTRGAEAVRTASLVLEGELRYLTAADIVAPAAESLRVRAVRGSGVVCDTDGTDILVRFRGTRLPNPRKDSVILVAAGEPAEAAPLAVTGVVPDEACGGSLRLTLSSPPTPTRAVLLVYETGSYHLADAALRYRAPGAGREPLTEAVVGPAAFAVGGAGAAPRLSLELLGDSLPRLAPERHDITFSTLHPWAPGTLGSPGSP